MIKKTISFLMCFIMVVGGLNLDLTVENVAAAQFNGTHFAMEFNGYDSGAMEKSNGWSNGGMFNCTWRDSNVSFSGDGIMNLKIDRDGNGGYSGGEYRTRQTFGYGMYQVNMKPIKNPGVVSSFFTYTGPTDGTRWDEIDIEFLGYDTTKVQFNYFSNGVGNHEHIYNLGFDASKEFHTYGFYWGQGVITWYVDGKAVYTVTSGDVPVTPGKIMMNVWPGTGVDGWLQAYNGATPLTAYYDWAVYDAPGSGSEPQTTKQPEPTKQPETTKKQEQTTQALENGYVWAGANWNELDFWSPYFASGWAGDPIGNYKNGHSYNDFVLRISKASTQEWGIQMKTKSLAVEAGKTYKCKIAAQSNMATANNIRLKDDISQSEVLKTLNAGMNYFEFQFTAGSSAQIFFDLGMAPAGLEFAVKSFSLEKVQEETQPQTTKTPEPQTTEKKPEESTNASEPTFQTLACDGESGLSLEYAIVSTTIDGLVPWYGDAGNTLSLQFTAAAGNITDITVNGQKAADDMIVEKGLGLVKLNPTKLASNSDSTIKVVTESGEFTIVIRKGASSEKPTEKETTGAVVIGDGIEINGYQVSATTKGMRTVYSVDSTINGKKVVRSGMLYSLYKYATEEELNVNSTSKYVKRVDSTSAGKLNEVISNSDIASSYAMTVKFSSKEAAEFNEGWRIRAYAELEDGTYVYTNSCTYTIYDIADNLYQSSSMATKEHHEYLYTDILSIVNKDYEVKEYQWSNSMVKA